MNKLLYLLLENWYQIWYDKLLYLLLENWYQIWYQICYKLLYLWLNNCQFDINFKSMISNSISMMHYESLSIWYQIWYHWYQIWYQTFDSNVW